MKKLMFAAAAIAAGVAMADITSANVVGYQNIEVKNGFNMIALNFQPVDGTEEIAIQDLINNKEGLIAGQGAATADQIQVWDGSAFTVYFYRANKTTTPKWTKGPGWVKVGAIANLTEDTIPSGKVFWYARPDTASAGKLT